MAPPIAERLESPLVFHGVKFTPRTKKRPTVAMSRSGMNLSTVVTTWKLPTLRRPVMFTAAGIHNALSAIRIVQIFDPPWLTNFST